MLVIVSYSILHPAHSMDGKICWSSLVYYFTGLEPHQLGRLRCSCCCMIRSYLVVVIVKEEGEEEEEEGQEGEALVGVMQYKWFLEA